MRKKTGTTKTKKKEKKQKAIKNQIKKGEKTTKH
jgi:hypothetical protein